MDTRSLFELADAVDPGPTALDVRRQSRIRVLNGRRRSLQSDTDRQRRRVNARRRVRARLDEMDDDSRAEWAARRNGLHVLG